MLSSQKKQKHSNTSDFKTSVYSALVINCLDSPVKISGGVEDDQQKEKECGPCARM